MVALAKKRRVIRRRIIPTVESQKARALKIIEDAVPVYEEGKQLVQTTIHSGLGTGMLRRSAGKLESAHDILNELKLEQELVEQLHKLKEDIGALATEARYTDVTRDYNRLKDLTERVEDVKELAKRLRT